MHFSQITKFVTKNMNGHLKPMVFLHGACLLDEPRRFPARVAIFASRPFVWKQTWCDCIHKSILWQSCGVCLVKYFTTWVACGLEISVECLGLPAFFSWGGCMQNRTFPWHQCEHRLRKVWLKFKSTTCPLKIDFVASGDIVFLVAFYVATLPLFVEQSLDVVFDVIHT